MSCLTLFLSLLLLLLVHPSCVRAGCQDEYDCNLNGACQAGTCVCVGIWAGPTCGQLSLGTVDASTRGALIPSRNSSRWCAGAVPDDAGTWHIFSAAMYGHCGLNSWQRNSIITHATAARPEGPYTNESTVFSFFAHNPKPLRAPDGTYLVFHIGCGDAKEKPIADCTNGTTPKTYERRAGNDHHPSSISSSAAAATTAPSTCADYGTSVLFADRPEGPWTNLPLIAPSPPNASYPFPASVDNPSALIFANGSVLLAFRSYTHPSGPLHTAIGLARAPHWRGPYVVDPTPIIPNPQEDPFLWYQPETDSFHMLFHNMGGCSSVGCHAFSKDSRTWHASKEPAYTFDVTYADGSHQTLKRRERPQLLFDPASGRPTHLINGVEPQQHDGGQEDFTFSMVAPLRYAESVGL